MAILGLAIVLGACGGRPAGGGDAARGQRLFSGEELFSAPDAPACVTCHNVNAAQGVGIGPNLAGLAGLAGTRVAGQDAADYLRNSLRNPDAYLVEGYQEGIMWRGYAETLTAQEIEDLVAYLLTLN